MRTTTAVILTALALSGCETDAPMEHATRPVSGTIIWRVYADHAELEAERLRGGGEPMAGHERAGAFARWTGLLPDGGCFIHSLYPGWYGTAEQFGRILSHEFQHCAEGHFHR